MSHKPFTEFCCKVACKIAGCDHDTMHAALDAVDNGTADPATAEGRGFADLSSLLDLIMQLLPTLLELFDNCPEARLVKRLKSPTRRMRNDVERRSRAFCQSCSAQRFGSWVEYGGDIGNQVIYTAKDLDEAELTAAVQDLVEPDYLLV